MGIRVLAVLAAAVACVTASQVAAQTAPDGRRIYERSGCYQCHGREGQGGVAGPRLGPEPLPLEAFTDFVRGTTGAMPAYGATVLTDAELAAIHAFLSGVARPRPVDRIPALRDLP